MKHLPPRPTLSSLLRGSALAGVLGSLLLAGCGGDGESTTGASTGVSSGGDAEGSNTSQPGDESMDDLVPLPGDHKVVRVPMTTAGPGSLDPIQGSTTYDNRCTTQMYDTLLQYSYLERPLELEPLLAAAMPEMSEDGLTWTFTLRDDVFFHDDACFPGGKGRKLVAEDVVYSWKRAADPRYEYKNYWLLENTLVGLDEYKEAQKDLVDGGAEFDYGVEVEGLRALDESTVQLKFVEANQQFAWKIAMFQLSVVPREAVETYGTGFSGHPVGTGPFRMEDESAWVRDKSLTLVRNEDYDEEYFPAPFDEYDREHGFGAYEGQRLPMVDEIQISFFVEDSPMWQSFVAKKLEYTTVPESGFDDAFRRSDKELKSSWAAQGITFHPVPLLDFIFRGFNMEDELLGGYSEEKQALRQAICLSLDWDEMNEAYYNGTAIVYDGMIPPGLDGYPEDGQIEGSYRGSDLERARAKFREAGYDVDAEGKVQGLPPIDFYTSAGATSQKHVALVSRNLDRVGVSLNPRFLNFAELIEAIDKKQAAMFSFAWGSDYPDAENNLALFYGPNESPGSNHFNYKNDEYDRMYEKIRTMPPGDERTQLYVAMRDMVLEDAPYAGSLARVRRYLIHPWLKNFKPTETFYNYMKYWDVDMDHELRSE